MLLKAESESYKIKENDFEGVVFVSMLLKAESESYRHLEVSSVLGTEVSMLLKAESESYGEFGNGGSIEMPSINAP